MSFGVTRQGPSAPLACQLGKYDTFDGGPVCRPLDTCERDRGVWSGRRGSPLGRRDRLDRGPGVTDRRAGPWRRDQPWASSTLQRIGWSYQASDWSSQPAGAGSTPERTAGSLCSGVTQCGVLHEIDLPQVVWVSTPL